MSNTELYNQAIDRCNILKKMTNDLLQEHSCFIVHQDLAAEANKIYHDFYRLKYKLEKLRDNDGKTEKT